MPFYTYTLECSDGTLYTGWTTCVESRLQTHNAGKGAKYTRSRLPVRLLYAWPFETKTDAMAWEWQFKQLARPKKLKLLRELTDDPKI